VVPLVPPLLLPVVLPVVLPPEVEPDEVPLPEVLPLLAAAVPVVADPVLEVRGVLVWVQPMAETKASVKPQRCRFIAVLPLSQALSLQFLRPTVPWVFIELFALLPFLRLSESLDVPDSRGYATASYSSKRGLAWPRH
jgi:hypothetical protein